MSETEHAAELQHRNVRLNFATKAEHRLRPVHRRKEEHVKMWTTPKEATLAIALAAEKKAAWSVDKYFVLTFIAGFFIGVGATCGLTIAALFSVSSPPIARLTFGLVFPIGLTMIVLLGGELFTDNCMGVLQRNVSWWTCIPLTAVSFAGNWGGCVFAAWLFGRAGDMFILPPFSTYVIAITEYKVLQIDWGAVVVRGIGANLLVCFALYGCVAAEDVPSKILSIYIPISSFIMAGFEHSVANMFICSLGIFVGADVGYGEFIYKNLIPSTIGNFLGGGIFISFLALSVLDEARQLKVSRRLRLRSFSI